MKGARFSNTEKQTAKKSFNQILLGEGIAVTMMLMTILFYSSITFITKSFSFWELNVITLFAFNIFRIMEFFI